MVARENAQGPSMQCMSAFQTTTSMLRVASQWATTAEPGIFSQIVICLFASGYLRYIVLQYVIPDTLENIELTAYLC